MKLDQSEVGWIVVGVFFLTGWHSWSEWRYFRAGEWAEARVEGTAVVTRTEDRERRGFFDSGRNEFQVLRVDFEYTDIIQANPVRSSLDFSATSPIHRGDRIRVQYIPNAPHSARTRSRFLSVMLFLASTAWLFWKLFQLAREANRTPNS